jgi:hypothetical protein
MGALTPALLTPALVGDTQSGDRLQRTGYQLDRPVDHPVRGVRLIKQSFLSLPPRAVRTPSWCPLCSAIVNDVDKLKDMDFLQINS